MKALVALEKRVLLGFSLAALVLLISGGISFRAERAARESSQWVQHTLVVLADLEGLSALVGEAESSQRGFIIADKREYAETFDQRVSEISPFISRVMESLKDNPTQSVRAAELAGLIERRVRLLQEGIAIHRREGFQGSRRFVLADQGRQLSVRIVEHIRVMKSEEKRLLALRTAAVDTNSRRASFISGLSILIAVALVLSSALLVNRDVLLRQAAEERAVASERLKAEFLANMSHEIRTPLNGVLGIAALLLRAGLNPKQTTYAKLIQRSGQSLLSIINDILDFSKIEAGKLTFEEIHFNLRDLIADVFEVLAITASQKGVLLQQQLPCELPGAYIGDPGRLRQVITNLAGNGIKFTSEGSVTIRITNMESAETYSDLMFEIQDTGMGISREVQDRLFQKFEQGDSSRTRKFGGTGLGLSICKQLVEMMGGEIGVRSLEGTGSTFWFSIRLPIGDASKIPGSEAAVAEVERQQIPADILVADDNQINQITAEEYLKSLGHRVVIVGNGAQALKAVQSTRFDLVLMDCQMPEMDGYEASRRIREYEAQSGATKTPIYALTADAMSGDRDKATASGMDGYLTKPIQFEVLAATIASVLGRRSAIDSSVLDRVAAHAEPGSDFRQKIIVIFREDSSQALRELEAAVQAGDWEEVRQRAHFIKSSAGNVGANLLAALADRVENNARTDRDAGALAKDVAELAKEFERACSELDLETPKKAA